MRNITIVENRTNKKKPSHQTEKKEIKAYPTPEEEFEKIETFPIPEISNIVLTKGVLFSTLVIESASHQEQPRIPYLLNTDAFLLKDLIDTMKIAMHSSIDLYDLNQDEILRLRDHLSPTKST